jgi:hypothetical protein
MFSCNLSKYLNKNVFSGSNDLFLKVLFYASFCLLACIVQPGTATADEKKMFESVQEIGTLILEDYEVPYLTAFAAATESLYVLAQGKLIQYHLKPLEKINSFDVGFKIPPGRIDTVINGKHRVNWPTHAQIFITNDETKLIIYTGKELKLLDLDKRQIVKTVSLDFYGELNKRAVLNGDELAIFDDGNRITIWNSNSLKQIKQFNSYPWSKQGPPLCQDSCPVFIS